MKRTIALTDIEQTLQITGYSFIGKAERGVQNVLSTIVSSEAEIQTFCTNTKDAENVPVRVTIIVERLDHENRQQDH